GYLVLAERLWQDPTHFSEPWNFGPRGGNAQSVEAVARQAANLWGSKAAWQAERGQHPHETIALRLDAAKAGQRLIWHPRLDFDQSLAWTIEWYRQWHSGADAA